MNDPSNPPLFADAEPLPQSSSKSGVDPVHGVALAMALLWTFRPRTTVHSLLGDLGLRRDDGRAYVQEDVKQAIRVLRARGSIVDMPHRDGYVRLTDALRSGLYRELLETLPATTLRSALHRLDRYQPREVSYHWPIHDAAATIAIVRLALFTGTSVNEVRKLAAAVARRHDWSKILREAVLDAFDGASFERVATGVQWDIAFSVVTEMSLTWRAELLPVCEWAIAKLASERDRMSEPLRLALAELLVHRGGDAAARHALEGLDSGAADALRACVLVQEGSFAEAQRAFEAALKRRQAEVGARKRVLPTSVAWFHPLALLAQQSPKHLEAARKFCMGEAGTRTVPVHPHGWGLWAHAVSARLGDAALDREAFEFRPRGNGYYQLDDLWMLLLAAWLGREALGLRDAGVREMSQYVAGLRERLARCGLDGLVKQVDAAEAVLRGKEPAATFFVSGPRERWRDVLASLQALGAAKAASDGDDASRIVWAIRIGKRGDLDAIEALEQKRGPRGFGKPKPVSLAKIAGSTRLTPWDAKVARTIRRDKYSTRIAWIDRSAAMMALVGHPGVVLADDPSQFVEVVEGTPEIEVVKEGEAFTLRVTPALRPNVQRDDVDGDDDGEDDDERDAEALQSIAIVRDTPTRIRVIRFSPAQRRAAQLLSTRFAVPATAHDELQRTLHALAGHFQVHSDHAVAAREVASEARLRAELAPTGEQLSLRLVVAPLGPEGPRLVPGAGRTRVMASIGGETVGTRRDLAAERKHLEAVLDALPFLEEPDDANAGYAWTIGDPEDALNAVEALPRLDAVTAMDWPKGKPVRVHAVDTPQLGVAVRTERDWFRLEARVAADESIVLELQALLEAARSRSRFVPMGDGVYVSLTRSLKARLNDIAAVGEIDGGGLRVPRIAAAWLDEALESTKVDTDADFRAAIERLRRAQDEAPDVPKALQAELRAYQEDGYRWAMRLASAGLGGCLADDMGLGKTLQALAVLLARGAGGPALVVAPTSVCGNWLAEAARFAPTLNVMLYGEGERESTVANAGPMDVIVVSYTLLAQAQERFAARRFHTIVTDEAQAIKNAAAKRSQAVFDLDGDFRLALSGTPVENRLAELWSIMRFVNPGLLGTLARFTRRFASPIERDHDRDAQQTLKRLIAPFLLRRTKAQVLQELPARTELSIVVVPEAGEAAHYEALRRLAIADADRALAGGSAAQARINVLAQLMRLRRAACDPRLVNPDMGIAGAKVQAFEDLAVELAANGHKALVFSQFVDFLSLLREPLDRLGIAYQYLDGATPAAERTRRVAAFQAGQGDLFLISLKAGGFGLNLTAADYVLITDPWWNPAAEDQAMGRAHRIGQKRPVTVYRLVAKGTVEERIVELHRDKRGLAESILADGDAALLPSTDDLISLMRGDDRARRAR
jgi:superfamily II DNA or RNA helicase